MLLSVFRMSSAEAAQMEDSVKDQSSLHYETTTSDEHIDPYCEICVEDKKRRIVAVGLCEECNTFRVSPMPRIPFQMA